MKSKVFSVLSLSILMLIVLVSSVSAVDLATWSLIDNVNSDSSEHIDATTLMLGEDLNTPDYYSEGGIYTNGWSEDSTLENAYYEITLSPESGYNLEISAINLKEYATSTEPESYIIKYSKDNFATTPTNFGSEQSTTEDDFSEIPTVISNTLLVNDGEAINLRLYGYNSGSGNWGLKDLVVQGEVTPIEEEPEEITACELVGEENLGIDIRDITVINGFGDDEEWLSLDEIEVEIEVENTNNEEKIKDIQVEWGLWSEETNEWVIELDEIDEFDLKKDREETITINFKLNEKKLDVNLDELEEGDYTLYVIANGEEQERTPDEAVCSFNSEAVKIFVESDFVILNNFELNGFESEDDSLFPESVQCGADIEITADVWNIGEDDQDDVYVVVYNKELGIINEKIEIGDIDAFEDEKLVLNLKVPQDLEEKWYNIDFRVYDEDDDIYENDYDEDKAEFPISLKVEGNCALGSQVSVTASLESGGKAGEELVIRATVTNTGNNLVTYTLNPEDYNEWATLTSVEPSAIILESGNSKDVLITFNVNQDASGDNLFNINVLSGDESLIKQPVSVTIEKQGFNIPGITGMVSEGNWYLWGIGALNIILVIVIILVAVKVSKKSE